MIDRFIVVWLPDAYCRTENLSSLHRGIDHARTLHHTGPLAVRSALLAVVVQFDLDTLGRLGLSARGL